jgi:hypothetical protein
MDTIRSQKIAPRAHDGSRNNISVAKFSGLGGRRNLAGTECLILLSDCSRRIALEIESLRHLRAAVRRAEAYAAAQGGGKEILHVKSDVVSTIGHSLRLKWRG